MSAGKSMISQAANVLRKALLGYRLFYLRRVWGMEIGNGARISMGAKLDKTHPKGIQIGEDTGVAVGAVILSHDFVKSRHVTTKIGKNCHIGAKAIVFPGVHIGDHCIVAPGAAVMKDVPDGCLVAGNPARVIEKGMELGPWGIRDWDGVR
jgi:acetyltransferase-like isoleucine patch superfamily enzyme